MPVSDLDIARAAHLLIQQHGDQATAKAREKVEEMRRSGDAEGADTWLRIVVASGRLSPRRQTLVIDRRRAGMAKTSAGILLFRRKGDLVEVFLVHPGGP